MDILFRYFPDLTPRQREQFQQLDREFRAWNERVNLIARSDVQNLAERHFLHSAAIAKVVQFEPGSTVLDVGTGGGLPGLPLAILFPEVEFHLIDSIGKKIKAVQDMARVLKLPNVTAEQIRAENVGTKLDYVVSRAVTRLANFYPWIAKSYTATATASPTHGLYYLKGGDLTEEIAEAKLAAQVTELSSFFSEEFFETKKVVFVPANKALAKAKPAL